MSNPQALGMLRIARRDLKAARMLQVASIDEASRGFQIQQVVEKAL
jgi:HEPN domain-containing protein